MLGACIRPWPFDTEPFKTLPVEMLNRYRAAETQSRIREGIRLSFNAIATALRNRG